MDIENQRNLLKTLIDDGVISPLMSKSIESPLNDLTIEPLSNKNDQQESNVNDSNENQSKTKLGNGSNGKRRTNREPLTFYQAQQAPRHRNNYPRAMQGELNRFKNEMKSSFFIVRLTFRLRISANSTLLQ